jgi:hypothetical protein
MQPRRRVEAARGRWVLSTLGALLLLAALLAVPRDWIAAFFRPLVHLSRQRPAPSGPLLQVLPPPSLEIAPADRPDDVAEPPPETLPRLDWWDAAWGDRLQLGPIRPAPPPALPRSLPLLLAAPTLADLIAQPDTSLGRILARLQAGDRWEFERMRALLSAAVHERRWQSILDQAERVHGEFQQAIEATPLPPPPEPAPAGGR